MMFDGRVEMTLIFDRDELFDSLSFGIVSI